MIYVLFVKLFAVKLNIPKIFRVLFFLDCGCNFRITCICDFGGVIVRHLILMIYPKKLTQVRKKSNLSRAAFIFCFCRF